MIHEIVFYNHLYKNNSLKTIASQERQPKPANEKSVVNLEFQGI